MFDDKEYEYRREARSRMHEEIDVESSSISGVHLYVDPAGGRLFRIATRQVTYYRIHWLGDDATEQASVSDMYRMARQGRIVEVDLVDLADEVVDLVLDNMGAN